ncbi:hypothetical protein MIND_00037400 [Mycena indigotica]|uniref:Uncharacterized protein n=1 Tax=Mycena indigotica TaxID=2126181 RepID=A0A8H6TAK6_9AGAR|nr:uncharacterized protein MIND_00037400 [Mycena indigotica]KAF7315230.1 hypothetical protein MIND_00037400 [Mycena indigotica]
MPTATSTVTIQPKTLKPISSSVPLTTLHTLYNRAARAFLHREIPVVHSLLLSAFALLQPPEQVDQADDYSAYRSKWDLLRITLETTVFTTPTSNDLPDSLRELVTLTPHSLLTTAYQRSLHLFTPRTLAPKALYIPSSVILTLVYSSLKLEAPDAGRVVVEDWLATRAYSSSPSTVDTDEEKGNYRKVVEAYCLHVLPKLEQWDYAKEFLDYECELTQDARKNIRKTLQDLHAQAISARLPPPSPVRFTASEVSPRPYSPTPSSSSSSSLSSTASVHTVVPATPRARSTLKSEMYRRASSPSVASNSTATPRQTTTSLPNASPPRVQHQQHLPRFHTPGSLRPAPPPTTFALLKASIAPLLASPAKLSVISIATFVLLLVLPLFVRRRRAARIQADVPGGNAELVRRRLLAASATSSGSASVLGRVLAATIRVVGDTIRMGGSGLV